MATTSLWKIQNRIDKVINYTTNSEKTENKEMYKALHNTIEYATADYKTEKQIQYRFFYIQLIENHYN